MNKQILVEDFSPEESRSWSLQFIYDKVRNHLIKQGKPSVGVGACLYRQGELMCAAGPFIPDSKLKQVSNYIVPSRDDISQYNYKRQFAAEFWLTYFTDEQLKLLRALQEAHDDYALLYGWSKILIRLDKVSEDFNLSK